MTGSTPPHLNPSTGAVGPRRADRVRPTGGDESGDPFDYSTELNSLLVFGPQVAWIEIAQHDPILGRAVERYPRSPTRWLRAPALAESGRHESAGPSTRKLRSGSAPVRIRLRTWCGGGDCGGTLPWELCLPPPPGLPVWPRPARRWRCRAGGVFRPSEISRVPRCRGARRH